MSTDASFAAAGGPTDGPGSAQPYGRAPSLRQAASFLRSSFSASTRFLGRMGSSNDPASRSTAAGLPPSGKGPRESFIGSLLNAVGLGGGHSRVAGSVSPSGGSRSGPSATARSKLMTSPSRTLARLSSAAMLRAEIQNYSQFGDLRNDSFSQASTAKLRRRSSLTGGGVAGAADEALAAAAAAEAAAAAGGGGGAAGLFRKLGSISLLRQSAPAPLASSPSVRASAPGMVHNGEYAINGLVTPRDAGGSRHGSPLPAARLARPSEGYSNAPHHQPPRYSHSGGPALGGDSVSAAGSTGRFHSPAHVRTHAPSQLSRPAAAAMSPPHSRPGTRGGSGGASPLGGASGADHGYVAETGGGGAPPPGALSRSGSLALRERPPTPKGRSPRSSVNGSPGRLGKVLGSFRLPDILTGGGSGRSMTERRNSVSGGTGVGAGPSFTRPSGPMDTSISGASGPAAAAVAAARQHRLSSGGGGALVRASGSSVTGGMPAMGPGGAAICAAAAKRAAALAAASGGSNSPRGGGPASAGQAGGGGGTPMVVAASAASVTAGAPRPSGSSITGRAPGLLGGILKDFQTSMELDEEGAMAAVEAEFDRRFGNGGRATPTGGPPALHSERTSPTQPMPGSRPQSGRHGHHHTVSALPPRSQSPHPPSLPFVPIAGAAPPGPDRGTPGQQQPFVRRRSTLGDGRPASPMQLRSAAVVMDAHVGAGAGGSGLESILSSSFDADGGGFLARRPGSASQHSPGSPPQGLNARMRLASIRMSCAEGIVSAAPPGPGGGGAGVIRGGPAPTVVPGLVASPSVSQGGVPPLPPSAGMPGLLPQQASPLVSAARPPSCGGGVVPPARLRSASGASVGAGSGHQ
ncbi:hypothetical protein HXX76_003760 [Chlamydomonas incerta]|uniref:Uncharacterized protein n=1 Tax=Chlamydomonas incerta TaxID=51695 RepID=A0A835W534_CHLIN|nr:hypothetical protein HXX76_003760 [Chlamydomonas incerta]|eukprot:KAG2440907.1 hypothetical protein HXX76_003760 [Chlamydomonas incerta]